jgi:hypothetical protein
MAGEYLYNSGEDTSAHTGFLGLVTTDRGARNRDARHAVDWRIYVLRERQAKIMSSCYLGVVTHVGT